MKQYKKEELSSPRLKDLNKELNKIEKAEEYLEEQNKKLKKDKDILKNKIKKEKEILRLRNRINFLQGRKKTK
jgi:hypothetical protein